MCFRRINRHFINNNERHLNMTNYAKILFQMAERLQLDICINPDDGNIYMIGEQSESVARLHPIDEPGQEVICFEPSRLITAQTVDKETALQRLIIGNETEINGMETDAERSENGRETDAERNENGFVLEVNQDVIGAGKVNLRRFSGSCPADVADVAAAIEKLLDAAIMRTNKPQTIEKLIKLHAMAARLAADGNIYKLNQIAAKLRGISRKQRAMKISGETVRRRAARRKALIKIAVVFVMAAALVGWGWVKIQPAPKVATVATTNDPATGGRDTISPTPTPLMLALSEFEQETGKKVWPAGRACIEKTAQKYGIIDNKEALKQLVYNSVK